MILFFTFILNVSFVFAGSLKIDYVGPTPANNSGAQTFQVNTTIIELNLKNATYNFNGTAYNTYNPVKLKEALLLLMNFDNQTQYGENETYFFDSSGNGNNGTAYGNTTFNVLGKYNTGIILDGSGNRVQLPIVITSNLINNSGITYSAWIKTSSATTQSILGLGSLDYSTHIAGEIYILSTGQAKFAMRSSAYYTVTSSSTYGDGGWHNIFAVFNATSRNMSLYIDGVKGSVDTTLVGSILNTALNSQNIGINAPRTGQYFNGSIDEVMIWNRSLSAEEIGVLYESQVKNYVDTGVSEVITYPTNNSNITMHLSTASGDGVLTPNFNLLVNQTGGLGIGFSYNYFTSIYDLAGNYNSTEIRTIRGNSAPSITSLTQTPSSYDNLDPGVTVIVTINVSDFDNNFDSALLQWKNSTSDWTNIMMDNITSKSTITELNTSFILPNYETNITYRIYTNDTLGDSEYSSNYTINSSWDCGWISTTDLGASAGWTSTNNKNVGTIIINNTGDSNYSVSSCSLDFRLTHSLTEGRIYFDGDSIKPSDTYTIPANSSISILINATFLNEITSEEVLIITSEIRSRTNTSSRNTTLSLVSNQNGPYLYQKITSNPNTVYLTEGTFNLESYIRNLMGSDTYVENKTAFNITFYWDLPSGLINSSGNLTNFYGNLSDSNTNLLNAEINFSNLASFSPGTIAISLKAYGYNSSASLITDVNNNTLLIESINITFSCYNVPDGVYVIACGSLDGDYPTPDTSTTTTTSGGGGGGSSSGGKIERSEASFELLRGEKQEFDFEIKNKYHYNMQNLKISVEGINTKYLSISPIQISNIPSGSSETIKIKVDAPSYFSAKEYELIFTIQGTLEFNGTKTSFTENKYVSLYILDLPREEADEMLRKSLEMIVNMNSSSMILVESLILFDTINNSYQNTEFNDMKKAYEKLALIYKNAFDSKAFFAELGDKIKNSEENGIKVEQTKKLLYLAEVAYNRGDYALAIARLKEAKLTYGLETKGEFNLVYAVKNNPVESIGFVLLAGLVGMSGTLLFKFQLYRKRLYILKKEEVLLLELMKTVQRECFEGNKMSMEEYEIAMSQYERRLAETIQEKISTETKLAHLLKIRSKRRALGEEKKLLVDLVRKLQDDYLNKAKIETRVYENMLKSYTLRLGEVDEQLAFMDTQTAIRKKKGVIRRFKL